MSSIETFENWFEKLEQQEQSKLISHILESHLKYAEEGFFAGPHGDSDALFDGVSSGPSGVSATSYNKNSSGKCKCCGR